MKKLAAFLGALCLVACNPRTPGENDDGGVDIVDNKSFTLGADISWVTEMESAGHKFYTAAGVEKDCFELMKDYGLNAIRLRVWVDPSAHGNWCNTADFVSKARRAAAAGMDIMVDFHYSDWWADPAKQFKPAAWVGLGLEELKNAFEAHTRSVLLALKEAGITPKWVQVGNEITSGFLWDKDKNLSCASYDVKSDGVTYAENWANIGAFFNIGYKAVKSIFKDTIVIAHIDNGYDRELYDWFFDKLEENGAKWDMIGMSIYPYWAAQTKSGYKADAVISDCIKNISYVAKKYSCDVMIVETGFECADDKGDLASPEVLAEGKRLLARLINESKATGLCRGVIYWEPECKPGQYRLGAFTADGRPTEIMEGFK